MALGLHHMTVFYPIHVQASLNFSSKPFYIFLLIVVSTSVFLSQRARVLTPAMFSVLERWVSLYFAQVPHPEVESYIATFKYSRVSTNSRSFRVFYLFPPRPEEQTPGDDLSGILRGHIEVTNIDDSCSYDALSYCWEGSLDPSPYTKQRTDRILIEESDRVVGQLLISPALSTALRYLRSRGQALPIFVDQICINQQDSSDKSRQINLMGDIYRNCKCVIAWLDVATRYTDALFDFIPRISGNELLLQLIQQPRRSSLILKAAMDKQTDFSDSEVSGQDVQDMAELTRKHWDLFPHRGFLDICLRRWFRRIWIVQEACLGPKMVFVCGKRSCTVDSLEVTSHFRMLASSFQRLEGDTPLKHHQTKWDNMAMHNAHSGTTVMFRIFRERAAAQRPSLDEQSVKVRRGLENVVLRFNVDTMVHGPWARLGFSNPKDTIYALKGLVSSGDVISDRLVTDYDLPTATLFTNFTSLIFESSIENPPIDTLLLSQIETKIHELPSWVPDWSSNIACPHGYSVGCFPMFNAGGGGKEPYSYSEVDVSIPGVLNIKGIVLCEIYKVGTYFMQSSSKQMADPMDSPTILPQNIFRFFREVRELCEWACEQPNSASIPLSAKLDEAVWVTTTGGHGLSQTTEKCLLGTRTIDGKPLLGYLWEFQLQMEIFPTIVKRRRDGLASITRTWAVNSEDLKSHIPLLSAMFASLVYWIKRLLIELLNLYWLYRFFTIQPYIYFNRESEDHMYHGIFGMQKIEIGLLKHAISRHARRKCFASKAGHVGLGPVGINKGDVVVIPLGATLPVILRPIKDSWTCVGEAYCYGFMDGEALADKNKLDTRWFKIK